MKKPMRTLIPSSVTISSHYTIGGSSQVQLTCMGGIIRLILSKPFAMSFRVRSYTAWEFESSESFGQSATGRQTCPSSDGPPSAI